MIFISEGSRACIVIQYAIDQIKQLNYIAF
jgi:hypothetical protein